MSITLVGADVDLFAGWKTTYRFTKSMYLRFLVPKLVDARRAIYLDADTLVLTDLRELYSMDIGANIIAGVLDPGAVLESKIPRRANDPYLNSGVLLFDLEALRRDDMLEQSRRIYQQYEKEAKWPDQCIINKYAEGRKFVLNDRWNVRIFSNRVEESDFVNLLSHHNPAIVHFLGPDKPWHERCNSFISEYWWAFANELQIDTLKIGD